MCALYLSYHCYIPVSSWSCLRQMISEQPCSVHIITVHERADRATGVWPDDDDDDDGDGDDGDGSSFSEEGRVGAKAQMLESPGSLRELRMVQHGGRERVLGEKDGKRNQKGRKQEAKLRNVNSPGGESLGSFLR